jgi:APA family basic amino acid/polyamine antiporter
MNPDREGGDSAGRPALARVLGPFDVTMMVMGSVIGAGVFQAPARIAAGMGSLEGVLGAWAFGGLVAISGALVFAELGGMLPRTGGEYVFVRAGAGRFAAFLFGWMSLTAIVSSAIAYVAGVFVEHLEALLRTTGWIEGFGAEGFGAGGRKGIAVAVIVGLALLNARGVRLGASVQNVAMLAKIAGILCVVALGAAVGLGWIEPRVAPTQGGDLPWNWDGVGAALFGIVFTFGGWQNVASVASEIRNPGRNLPLGTLVGTLAVVVLYLALNTALVAVLGVRGVAESATPVAAAAGAVVSWGEPLVAGLVTVSTFAITQVLLMLAPRIYVAMADDGVFFRGIGQIHERFQTPARAILLQAAFAVGHVFVAGSIGELLEVCSICDWVFFTICGATLFVLRRKWPDVPRPYRAWGYPWMPAIFLACSAAVLVRIAMSAQTLPALQAAGLFVAGAIAYALWARRSPASAGG